MRKRPPQQLVLRGVPIPLDEIDREPIALAASRLYVEPKRILSAVITRRNVDARRGKPRFVVQMHVTLNEPLHRPPKGSIEAPVALPLSPAPRIKTRDPVVVVGTGPAGLFAAWRLCQAGLEPTLIDRGPAFPRRHQAIADLLGKGDLDPEANFHFGLGGAGTYSDGKLYTRLQRPRIRTVLEVLQRHGAGSRDQILVDAHPHVGTDRWPATLESFTSELVQAGCRFVHRTRVTGLRLEGAKLTGLTTTDGAFDCRAAILAPGNSARDLFQALVDQGVPIQAKAFAVGLRMTHPQDLIDRIQYGRAAGHPALGPASYRFSGQFHGRGVYSFCMCPGGTVVPTPTEPEGLCLNGMSNSGRDSGEANAAVVVTVGPDDFVGEDPMAGVAFQRKLERAAYEAGGGDYRAPAQTLTDFLDPRPSARVPDGRYRPGVSTADLSALLPGPLADALRAGLARFCNKVRGMADPRGVLLGLETRTSSPVRILRDPGGMSPGVEGLFPAGEGAGYAGGISSSAADGIRAADGLFTWLLHQSGSA